MTSEEYWREREKTSRKKAAADEEDIQKNIDRINQRMIDECSRQIDAWITKYAKKDGITLQEARRRISKADMEEFSRKAKELTERGAVMRRSGRKVTYGDFSDEENEAMRLYNLTMKVNRLELLKAELGNTTVDGSAELRNYLGEKLAGRALDKSRELAGILGKTVRLTGDEAAAITNASFKGATFSSRIWNSQQNLKADLDRALASALIRGGGSADVAKQIRKDVSSAVKRSGQAAMRLAVTEMARVEIDVQKKSFDKMGFEEYTFLATGPHPCEICQALDGKHFKVSEMQPGLNAPPMHPWCVLPDTKIAAPDIEAVTKSYYSGDVIELATANGRRLTVTLNHIVLTARGWVRAKNLVEGDKVIDYCFNISNGVHGEPNNDDCSSRIEDLFTSFAETSGGTTTSVPASSADLKGDVIPDSEIDVIPVDGILRDKLDPSAGKLFGDGLLIRAGESGKPLLSQDRFMAHLLICLGLVADGLVGKFSEPNIFGMSSLGCRDLVGLRSSSDYDSRLCQTAHDRRPRYSEGFGYRSDTFIGKVPSYYGLRINRDSFCWSDSSRVENGGNCFAVDSSSLRDFVDGQSRFIEFDDVVSIKRFFYSGHVYDASSLSTLYIANGIITSNCHCTVAAYSDRKDYDEWLDSGAAADGMSLEEYRAQRKAHSMNTGARVFFNDKADYYMDVDGVSDSVKKVMAEKAREIAKLGSDNNYEYGYLVDLDTGEYSDLSCDEEWGSVRPDYSFLKEHKNTVFLHNHNTDTELSLPDVGLAVNDVEINVVAAVRNDGIITLIKSNGKKISEYLPFKYLESGDKQRCIAQLKEKGMYSDINLEIMLRDLAISEYCNGGMKIYGQG